MTSKADLQFSRSVFIFFLFFPRRRASSRPLKAVAIVNSDSVEEQNLNSCDNNVDWPCLYRFESRKCTIIDGFPFSRILPGASVDRRKKNA